MWRGIDMDHFKVADLIGRTIVKIDGGNVGSEQLDFTLDTGEVYEPRGHELRAAIAAVQATWTPEIELERRVCKPAGASIPEYSVNDLRAVHKRSHFTQEGTAEW